MSWLGILNKLDSIGEGLSGMGERLSDVDGLGVKVDSLSVSLSASIESLPDVPEVDGGGQ